MEILTQTKEIFSSGLHELLTFVPDFPVYLLTVTFLFGVYKVFLVGAGSEYMEIIKEYAKTPTEEDKYFLKVGSNMTANQYTLLLYAAALFVFLVCGITSAMTGNIQTIFTGLILAAIIIFFLRPTATLYGEMKSVFVLATDFLSQRRKEELDKELFNSVTTLKNLAIAQEDDTISADLMIEKLMDNSKKLKPVYAQTLSLYRSGDKSRALQFFGDSVGTRNGKTFALTLEKLDKIDPYELKTQVLSLQEIMAEERYTKGLVKAENKGTIVYALATAVCFVCLLNFLFVCVLMDALEGIGNLF